MMEEVQPKYETVMIIDDNVIDLYISSRMISKNNFGKKVLQYAAASEALKYLQENQEDISMLPQIIFVDIYMPVMSGFEFLEAYDKLSLPLKKHCSIFIISSTIDDYDIAQAQSNINVVDFQVKPITRDFLIGIMTKKRPVID